MQHERACAHTHAHTCTPKHAHPCSSNSSSYPVQHESEWSAAAPCAFAPALTLQCRVSC